MAAYAAELYEAWARKRNILPKEMDHQRDILRTAAMLHDVGKVGISDVILKKPGRLTPEEYEIMKGHAVIGARLFDEAKSDFDEAADRLRVQRGMADQLAAAYLKAEPFLEEMERDALRLALDAGHVASGDSVVVTAGMPLHESGRTNLIKIVTVP